MITRSRRIRRFLLAALIIGLLAVPKVDAHGGGHGGHSGGHAAAGTSLLRGLSGRTRHLGCRTRQRRHEQHSAMQAREQQYSGHANRRTHSSNQQQSPRLTPTRAEPGQQHAITARTPQCHDTGAVNPATTAALNTTRATSNGVSPNTYTYGYGNGARNYRAYGYGNGYRNRRYGGGYGYGQVPGQQPRGRRPAEVRALRALRGSIMTIRATASARCTRSRWRSVSSRTGRWATAAWGFRPA